MACAKHVVRKAKAARKESLTTMEKIFLGRKWNSLTTGQKVGLVGLNAAALGLTGAGLYMNYRVLRGSGHRYHGGNWGESTETNERNRKAYNDAYNARVNREKGFHNMGDFWNSAHSTYRVQSRPKLGEYVAPAVRQNRFRNVGDFWGKAYRGYANQASFRKLGA